MLIISGTAEYTGEGSQFVKGDTHAFTMFCKGEELNDQLSNIENYFNGQHWDEIVIEESGLIENDVTLANDKLKQAFSNAIRDGLSVVIQNEPITKAA